MTLPGALLVLVVVGAAAYLTLRLVPVYLEHFSVVSSLRSLANEETQGLSAGEIRSLLMKRLQINDIKHVDRRDIKVVREGGSRKVSVEYEVREPLTGNLSLLVSFSDSVTLPGN